MRSSPFRTRLQFYRKYGVSRGAYQGYGSKEEEEEEDNLSTNI